MQGGLLLAGVGEQAPVLTRAKSACGLRLSTLRDCHSQQLRPPVEPRRESAERCLALFFSFFFFFLASFSGHANERALHSIDYAAARIEDGTM